MTNDTPRDFARASQRRSRWRRWSRWAAGAPADFTVAWVVCVSMVAAGYWLGRRGCRR